MNLLMSSFLCRNELDAVCRMEDDKRLASSSLSGIYAHAHIYNLNASMYVCMYIRMYVCMHACIYVYVCMYIYICIYIYLYIYIYTHTHTHML
jgi:hypothetical protein